MQAITERTTRRKLNTILGNPTYPLHVEITALRSAFSQKLAATRQKTNCFEESFMLVSIRLYNWAGNHKPLQI